jgi:hypothetical protein
MPPARVRAIVEGSERGEGAMSDPTDGAPRGEVEVRIFVGGLVGLRARKTPHNPYLVLTGSEWRAFTDQVRRGELDGIIRAAQPR